MLIDIGSIKIVVNCDLNSRVCLIFES